MGGEKTSADRPRIADIGSPPRGRGKVSSVSMCTRSPGITPAWAGKSCPERLKTASALDHPRVGGEKRQARTYTASCQGSPPRGRGKVALAHATALALGITPAWAGKSKNPLFKLGPAWDHPRVGGEKKTFIVRRILQKGSPPRGRGKVDSGDSITATTGITPAWAGKRLKRSHRSGIFISGLIPFHSVLHRPAGSGGSRAGRDGAPAGQPQNAGPA